MSLNASLRNVLQTLEAHILDLKDEGVRSVECLSPERFRTRRAAENSRPAPARPEPVPAPPPRAERPVSKPVPQSPAANETALPAFILLTAYRTAACRDATPREETALSLFCEQRDLKDRESGDLLRAMLAAIGYTVEGEGVPVSSPAELKACQRHILCFGDAAQQQLSPMKMALSLVRGKFQNTPYGRMMALESPAKLHNNPTGKKAAWGDLKRVLQDLGLELPPRG